MFVVLIIIIMIIIIIAPGVGQLAAHVARLARPDALALGEVELAGVQGLCCKTNITNII